MLGRDAACFSSGSPIGVLTPNCLSGPFWQEEVLGAGESIMTFGLAPRAVDCLWPMLSGRTYIRIQGCRVDLNFGVWGKRSPPRSGRHPTLLWSAADGVTAAAHRAWSRPQRGGCHKHDRHLWGHARQNAVPVQDDEDGRGCADVPSLPFPACSPEGQLKHAAQSHKDHCAQLQLA